MTAQSSHLRVFVLVFHRDILSPMKTASPPQHLGLLRGCPNHKRARSILCRAWYCPLARTETTWLHPQQVTRRAYAFRTAHTKGKCRAYSVLFVGQINPNEQNKKIGMTHTRARPYFFAVFKKNFPKIIGKKFCRFAKSSYLYFMKLKITKFLNKTIKNYDYEILRITETGSRKVDQR